MVTVRSSKQIRTTHARTQYLVRRFSQGGGYIPGYGLGGFLKKALIFGAGAVNPAFGAGVGGLMGLLDKKNRGKGFLKGALAGGLAGLATSKLAGGGKEAWDATAGKGMSALEKIMSVSKGVGKGVDPAIKALSDPKVLAFGAPMLGNLMNPEPEETVEDTSASSFNVAPSASSNPANWKDGKFIGAQGSGLGVMQGRRDGGYIPGYENGGNFYPEFDQFEGDMAGFDNGRVEESRQNFRSGSPGFTPDYSDLSFEEEFRRQIQQPDPLLEHPVGGSPTHGLDDGGERLGDSGFRDQSALAPWEDPNRQFIENKFTGEAGHDRYMGSGYNEKKKEVASNELVGNTGGVANHQDYVAGWQPETSAATGENAVNPVGLNPMKPQDQSALSTQQQDFIAQFGKAEGGPIQEAPAQIRDIIKAALMGTLPDSSIDVTH